MKQLLLIGTKLFWKPLLSFNTVNLLGRVNALAIEKKHGPDELRENKLYKVLEVGVVE